MTTPAIARAEEYQASFQQLQDRREPEPAWLATLRREAMARFLELGLPTSRWEPWKYHDLDGLRRRAFAPVAGGAQRPVDPAPFLLAGADSHRLVFVDGRLDDVLSQIGELPAGVTLRPLAELLSARPQRAAELLDAQAVQLAQPFLALNTAFFADGLWLSLAPGARLERPVEILWLSGQDAAAQMSSPRLLVEAGADSEALIIESFGGLGGGEHLSNAVAEIDLGARARISHLKLLREGPAARHLGASLVHQGAGSRYRSWEIALDGAALRREIHLTLAGEGALCELYGLNLGRDDQRLDSRTRVRHASPGCRTNELYKSILGDRSQSVFDGRIIVERDAQKTDAYQSSKALLLSEDAVANSMPQLEIYADDVRCTHGSTTGQLDEGQLFYLRTRGFTPEMARNLLVAAFASEILDSLESESLRQALATEVRRRLPGGHRIEGSS